MPADAGTMKVRIVVERTDLQEADREQTHACPGVRSTRSYVDDLPSGHRRLQCTTRRRPAEGDRRDCRQDPAARPSASPIPPIAARPGSRNEATRPPAATDICRTPSAAPRRSDGNPWNTEIVPATWISEPAMPGEQQTDRRGRRRPGCSRRSRAGPRSRRRRSQWQARSEAVDHDPRADERDGVADGRRRDERTEARRPTGRTSVPGRAPARRGPTARSRPRSGTPPRGPEEPRRRCAYGASSAAPPSSSSASSAAYSAAQKRLQVQERILARRRDEPRAARAGRAAGAPRSRARTRPEPRRTARARGRACAARRRSRAPPARRGRRRSPGRPRPRRGSSRDAPRRTLVRDRCPTRSRSRASSTGAASAAHSSSGYEASARSTSRSSTATRRQPKCSRRAAGARAAHPTRAGRSRCQRPSTEPVRRRPGSTTDVPTSATARCASEFPSAWRSPCPSRGASRSSRRTRSPATSGS